MYLKGTLNTITKPIPFSEHTVRDKIVQNYELNDNIVLMVWDCLEF
jgi:hypothetical protein